MPDADSAFAGSIPAIYDRHLGPLLFKPYAEEIGCRAAKFDAGRILETAAGTGLVTAALLHACPCARIVATDLNQAMLDQAAQRLRSDRLQLVAADAQHLPFGDAEFDLVVCQFGLMFMPDRVEANREARRVLRDGGRYLLVIWDSLDRNPVSNIVCDRIAAMFPYDPPSFLARTPFGYSDPARIEHDLLAAGFTDVELETVVLASAPGTTREDAAIGMVQGTPLKAEIEERDAGRLQEATEAARDALREIEGPTGFDSRLSAHVVTAIR
jgi:ubiquinone/menaquinone biosynthesis C-methylase UbiE